MTIAITCSCSARLEVDERFSGQSITCPDCQKSLEVPTSSAPAERTSGLAIASLILALVGAFTILGTLAAILLGGLALVKIRQNPARLAGKRIAVGGMIVGGVLTLLSLFAYTSTELFGVDSAFRESQWLGKLEYPSDLEVVRRDAFKIKRPSSSWGVYQPKGESNLALGETKFLMLVHPSKAAYVLCMAEKVPSNLSFGECQDKGIQSFRQLEITKFSVRKKPNLQVELDFVKKSPPVGEEKDGKLTRTAEMVVKKTYRGQTKTYVLRVLRKETRDQQGNQFNQSKSDIFVVAGGAPEDRFDSVRDDLIEAMDSFQILD
jgi:hypothetical protein